MNTEWIIENLVNPHDPGLSASRTAEYCRVKRAWNLVKGHVPNWIIAPRIRAAKAETFDDLRQAVRDCGDAYERKMAQVRNK
jgi:hypothetical protein